MRGKRIAINRGGDLAVNATLKKEETSKIVTDIVMKEE